MKQIETILDLLECPKCTGQLIIQEARCKCTGCGASYRYYPEIVLIDFFDENDRFAAPDFDSEDDKRKFNHMLKIYHKYTFAELQAVYNSGCDPEFLPGLQGTIGGELPDKSHGRDSIKKINALCKKNKIRPDYSGCILENGCGHGYFGYEFATTFANTIITDCSLSYLLLASKFIDNCSRLSKEKRLNDYVLTRADSMRLPIKSGSLSAIHSNNVIEHVSNPSGYLAEMHRSLAVQGVAYIVSPNRFSILPEPHFGIRLYGIYPKSIARRLIYKKRPIWLQHDMSSVNPLGINTLRHYLRASYGKLFSCYAVIASVYPAMPTRMKRAVLWVAKIPLVEFFINRLIIYIAPCHYVLAYKSGVRHGEVNIH